MKTKKLSFKDFKENQLTFIQSRNIKSGTDGKPVPVKPAPSGPTPQFCCYDSDLMETRCFQTQGELDVYVSRGY